MTSVFQLTVVARAETAVLMALMAETTAMPAAQVLRVMKWPVRLRHIFLRQIHCLIRSLSLLNSAQTVRPCFWSELLT